MPQTFDDIQRTPTQKRIIIVGGGIIGASLAFHISEKNTSYQIVLLDRSLQSLVGSTSSAPGLVGQLNESSVWTKLAKDSVREYLTIPGAFDVVGGLEVVSSTSGIDGLNRRLHKAHSSDLPATLVSPEKAASLAPDFIRAESVKLGLFFPSDGIANPRVITAYYSEKARANGVVFLEADVKGLETKSNGSQISSILTSDGPLQTTSSIVILATGIWTKQLLLDSHSANSITKAPIPIVPVAHPYTYSQPRPARKGVPYPFVRWPESHVYARDHGTIDGVGTYHHAPRQVSPAHSAVGDWPTDFEKVLATSITTHLKNAPQFLTKNNTSGDNSSGEMTPFNGIFAVTPDSLPLAGKVTAVENLWLCAGVWITTAAGTAKLIARQIISNGEENTPDDTACLKALDPDRFHGVDSDALVQEALGTYNDIYNSRMERENER